MTESATTVDKLGSRLREMYSALAAMFLLGMGANLLGAPSENTDGGRVVAGIVLGLHILVGVGLIAVAVRLLMAARKASFGERDALVGLVVLAVTFVDGVLTMITNSGWLSLIMAIGFLAAAALYVKIGLGVARAKAASAAN